MKKKQESANGDNVNANKDVVDEEAEWMRVQLEEEIISKSQILIGDEDDEDDENRGENAENGGENGKNWDKETDKGKHRNTQGAIPNLNKDGIPKRKKSFVKLVSFFAQGKQLGIAVYDEITNTLQLWQAMDETFSYLQYVKYLVDPTVTIIPVNASEELIEAVKSPLSENASESQIHYANNRNFSYEHGKKKLQLIKLPCMPVNVSPDEKLQILSSFINFEQIAMIRALGGLVSYMLTNLIELDPLNNNADEDAVIPIADIVQYKMDSVLCLDVDTMKTLQIFQQEEHPCIHGRGRAKEGLSLYGLLNCTKSILGKSLLRIWLLRPPRDLSVILERQEIVSYFLKSPREYELMEEIRSHLRLIKDIPRILARVKNASASVNDWASLCQSSVAIYKIREIAHLLPRDLPLFQALIDYVNGEELYEIAYLINSVVDFDESKQAGRAVIKYDVHEQLDQLKQTYSTIDDFLTTVAKTELRMAPSEIQKLNVSYFPQLGYLIVIPKSFEYSFQIQDDDAEIEEDDDEKDGNENSSSFPVTYIANNTNTNTNTTTNINNNSSNNNRNDTGDHRSNQNFRRNNNNNSNNTNNQSLMMTMPLNSTVNNTNKARQNAKRNQVIEGSYNSEDLLRLLPNYSIVFETNQNFYCKSDRMRELDEEIGDLFSVIIDIEQAIMRELQNEIVNRSDSLSNASGIISQLDVLCSFAVIARNMNYCRPKVIDTCDGGRTIVIKQGRHPLQELVTTQTFVPNDVTIATVKNNNNNNNNNNSNNNKNNNNNNKKRKSNVANDFGIDFDFDLDDEDDNDEKKSEKDKDKEEIDDENSLITVVTGPNGSGKSVYLKQIGLIVFMAHLGSFVPAKSAIISLTDRMFARIQSRESYKIGQSTFMIDLHQVNTMFHNYSSNSLLLIDEFGKGTTEEEGAALLAATIRFFLSKQKKNENSLACPRLVVSTHIFEIFAFLPEEKNDERMRYLTMKFMLGKNDEVLNLFVITEGKANNSFGMQCALQAGMPKQLVTRSEHIAAALCNNNNNSLHITSLENTINSKNNHNNNEIIVNTFRQCMEAKMSPQQIISALAKYY